MKNSRQRAESQIQKNLHQPGHKAERKQYNSTRRGYRIKGTSLIESAPMKAKKRESLKRETRHEIDEADR